MPVAGYNRSSYLAKIDIESIETKLHEGDGNSNDYISLPIQHGGCDFCYIYYVCICQAAFAVNLSLICVF